MSALDDLREAAGIVVDGVPALIRNGVARPIDPRRLPGMAQGALRAGPTLAAVLALGAGRHPDRDAILDERGAVTYGELSEHIEAVAGALHQEARIGPGRTLGVLCRNHRGFVVGLGAGSRLGADLVLLNTDFSGRQLADVLARESVHALIADEEYLPALADYEGRVFVAWHDDEDPGHATLEDLAAADAPRAPRPRRSGRAVLLTSGTTGTPKGAGRAPSSVGVAGPFVTILARVPLRSGERIFVGPPLFHGFGIAFGGLAVTTGMTLVLRRRFDPAEVLATVERERVSVVCGVPVMLQRLLALAAKERARRDASSLRAIVSGGAPLSGDLALALMGEFGEIVFNLYGSTETGWGAMAGPRDLRAAPGTVGRAPHGTSIRILDPQGRELETGETGRIFMRNRMLFEQYTGGGGKEVVDGHMSTGDLGHLDDEERLFVEGRDDDMIVSGGENVFPQEVQETIAAHPAVADVAVIGVDDEDFGQRLAAFVVLAADADAQASADDLRAHVKEHLARYKVPRDVEFVDEIPRNPTGKILKRRLQSTGTGA